MKVELPKHLNLKWKFILVIVIVTTVVSAIQNFFNYQQNIRLYTENLQNRNSVLAQVLGSTASAVIQFRNREEAAELLHSLHKAPSVREAYLFDSDGQSLAQYVPDGQLKIPMISLEKDKIEVTEDRIIVLNRIELDNKFIGAIYIASDLSELWANQALQLKIGAAVLTSVIILALLLALWSQRYFVNPIIELAHLAERVGCGKEYSLRATAYYRDELGTLADNFNFMLDVIQSSEKELQKRTEQLEHSNEQLEQFANIAAHDLQEPLRKVRSYAARLVAKCRADLSTQGQEYLERMDRSVERMQILVNDLLEFSRIKTRAKPFSKTDLTSVLDTVVTDLQILISEVHGQVEIGELPRIDADTVQIQQLFQNLIANGLKFHRKNLPPVVTVSSRLLSDSLPDKGDSPSSKFCEIIVADNGIGFEEKYLDRVFQPFQRLHGREEYAGTGMGLAICRRIVDRHNGSITARTTPDNGAEFIVTLPVQQQSEIREI